MTESKDVLKLKRRREQKTDYKKRLALLKSKKARMVVRISNKYITSQVVNYLRDGDETVACAHSSELNKFGFTGNKNIPSCYLTGYLLGKRAVAVGLNDAVLDIGLHTPIKKCRLFAALQGAVDAGLNVPNSKEAVPEEHRLKGMHIIEFASKLSEEDLKKRFSEYLIKGNNPKELADKFAKAKSEIDKNFSSKSLKGDK